MKQLLLLTSSSFERDSNLLKLTWMAKELTTSTTLTTNMNPTVTNQHHNHDDRSQVVVWIISRWYSFDEIWIINCIKWVQYYKNIRWHTFLFLNWKNGRVNSLANKHVNEIPCQARAKRVLCTCKKGLPKVLVPPLSSCSSSYIVKVSVTWSKWKMHHTERDGLSRQQGRLNEGK